MPNRQGAPVKSNVPWSVKGIDPEARVVAKEAARKAGMTLGEWMNHMIQLAGEDQSSPADDAAPSKQGTGVSTEQLRTVIDSLNRLNDRLKTTQEQVRLSEEKSRAAASGLNLAVETVFERLKRVEKERKAGAPGDIVDRVEKLEQSDSEKKRIEGLKHLELALTQMVDQFDATRTEAISRVEANETAVSQLGTRVDHLDQRVTAGFEEVNDALTAVSSQLDHTERTAKSVLLDARDAAGSTDAEFVERTGKKLQLLGSEIKRSGDQITAVENMVSVLTEKIEDAERRSADGIADVSAELDALRDELSQAGIEVDDNEEEARWQEVAREAEEKVASLEATYETMVARLGDAEADIAPSPDAAVEALDTLFADNPAADETIEDEFDDIFGTDTLVLEEPEPTLEHAHDDELPVERDHDDPVSDAVEEGLFSEDVSPQQMTPREKIIAAARARHERLSKEQAEQSRLELIDEAEFPEEPVLIDDTGITGGSSVVDADGQNPKVGLPLLVLLGVVLLGAIIGGVFLMTRDGGTNTAGPNTENQSSTDLVTTSDGETSSNEVSLSTPPPDGAILYAEGKAAIAEARTAEEYAAGFNKIREAAIFGHVPARYRLGELYFSGQGTTQDLHSAETWFTEAALSGNAAAMHRLGSLAIDSNFEGQNVEEALDWFGRAADLGVIDSMYNLGYLYDPATDGYLPVASRNAEEAYFWYSIAASQGDPVAREDAANVAARMSSQQLQATDQRIRNWTPRPYDPRVNDGLQIVN